METTIEIVHARDPKLIAVPAGGLGVIVPPHPVTARTLFANHPGVVLAVDGAMFSYCAGEPHSYETYQCGSVDFLIRDDRTGAHATGRPSFAQGGITYALDHGRLVEHLGRVDPPGTELAFQLYPALVANGAVAVNRHPPDHPDSQRNSRVAVGRLRDGRVFFAYGNASMYDFAEQLIALGAVSAGYTDGGGSASLVMRLPDGTLQGSDANDPGGRRVPSWIVWARDPATDLVLVGDRAAMTVTEILALTTLLATIGGTALWLVLRKR